MNIKYFSKIFKDYKQLNIFLQLSHNSYGWKDCNVLTATCKSLSGDGVNCTCYIHFLVHWSLLWLVDLTVSWLVLFWCKCYHNHCKGSCVHNVVFCALRYKVLSIYRPVNKTRAIASAHLFTRLTKARCAIHRMPKITI